MTCSVRWKDRTESRATDFRRVNVRFLGKAVSFREKSDFLFFRELGNDLQTKNAQLPRKMGDIKTAAQLLHSRLRL